MQVPYSGRDNSESTVEKCHMTPHRRRLHLGLGEVCLVNGRHVVGHRLTHLFGAALLAHNTDHRRLSLYVGHLPTSGNANVNFAMDVCWRSNWEYCASHMWT